MRHRTIVLVALGACVVLWASGASAQARWGERKLSGVQSLGSKRAGQSRGQAARAVKGGAVDALDVGAYQRRYLILAKRKEVAIRRMIGLMRSNVQLSCPGSTRCAGYLFRLAELYNAMRMNRWAAAMGLHEPIYQARDRKQAARVRRLRRRQKALFARSARWLERALKQYVRITNNRRFAGFARMDEVVFSVGDIAKTLAEQAGRRKDQTNQRAYQKIMLAMFGRLVRQFPRSRFVPDALLAKGEYLFNGRRFIEAIRVYRKVALYKTKVGAYAAYKIGWGFLNLKRYRLALAQFVGVVKSGRGGKHLIRAAHNDVVRAYSHIGRPEKAYGFFHRVGGKRPRVTRRLYLLLGTLYYAQGKNPECIRVFRDAVGRWPRDKVRCRWVTTIVDATINLGDKDRQVAAVRELGQVTRALTKQLGSRARPVRRCRSATENTIKMLATQWHREGLATGSLDTFYWNAGQCYEAAGMLGPAVAMRRRIVKSFPRSPHAALATYYTAGNYHNLAFFRDAARWYERFSKQHGSHRQAADALMWAIVLRGGLGQQRAMMKNAAAFIQRYRRRNPKLSAKAFWLVVKMHESLGNADRLLINLQRYAREYARSGDADKAIEAHARLAALYWRSSCKVTPVHGQCLRIRYYRRKGHKQKRIRFLARDRRLVKAAQRHVTRAWALWANGRAIGRIPRGDPRYAEMVRNARHWAAYARFMQAELRFEPYLKLRIPRRLNWDPRDARRFGRTVKRFRKWIMTKLKTARALELSYLSTVTKVRITQQGKRRGDPHWSIAVWPARAWSITTSRSCCCPSSRQSTCARRRPGTSS